MLRPDRNVKIVLFYQGLYLKAYILLSFIHLGFPIYASNVLLPLFL